MGGAIARATAVGTMVEVVVITSGEQAGDSAIRQKESATAGELIGVGRLHFWNIPDRQLDSAPFPGRQFSQLLARLRPRTVFIPGLQEYHPDHRSAALRLPPLLQDAGYRGGLWLYEISRHNEANRLVDITPVLARKQAAIRCFASQLSLNDYEGVVLGLNRSRSYTLPAAVTYAEAFREVEAGEWSNLPASLAAACRRHWQEAASLPQALVSLIVRTRNRPGFLAQALASIALQTYEKIEVVVVNDGGCDVAELVASALVGRRFQLIALPENRGRAAAANVGLAAAAGKYIGFLDDDDAIDPDHVESLVAVQERTGGESVVYAGVRGLHRNDLEKGEITCFADGEVGFVKLLLGNRIPIHGVMFPASVLRQGIRFDEGLDCYEDWDFWLQVAREVPFIFSGRVSATYYADGSSGVGLGGTANPEIMRLAGDALIGKWLGRISPEEFKAIGDLYHRTCSDLYAASQRGGALQHEVTGLQREAAERDERITRLNQAVAERDGQLLAMYNATSWRITRPLRAFANQIKRGRRGLLLVDSAIKRGNGVRNTLKKGVSLYRREGWAGIKRGLALVAEGVQARYHNASGADFLGAVTTPALDLLDLRVLIIAELSIPQCTKYRVTQKQEWLGALGVDCTVVSWTDAQACLRLLATHALVIFYRVPAVSSVLAVMAEARRLKVHALWEVDDLIFARGVLENSRALGRLDRNVREGLLEGADLYRQAMLACDGGIASTSGLARAMTDAGVPEVFVIENALDAQTLVTAERLAAVTKKPNDGIIRIVYGSGTDTHNVDFLEAATALRDILEACNNVRFRLIGKVELPAEFSKYNPRIERIPFCSYEEYLGHLAECQISIAPLEPYVFNDAKSNIKFLEAAILKIPSVCSPRAAFADAVTHGVSGFLCDTPEAWTQALTMLVSDEVLRQQMGEAAYALAMERYAPGAIGKQQVAPLLARFKRAKRTRILSVNIFYAPRSFGGATIVAEEVNKLLSSNGEFDMYVFTALPTDLVEPYAIRRYEAMGVDIFGIAIPESTDPRLLLENPNVSEAFAEVLAAVNPDIVHFHSIQGIGLGPLDLCAAKGIPYVVTLHDAWWLCGRQFMIDRQGHYCHQQKIDFDVCSRCVDDVRLNNYRQVRLRKALQGAAKLLSPSRFFADLYIKNDFPSQQVVVNKNGICQPRPQVKRRSAKPLTFGYVGGNTEIKGVHLVKQVFLALASLDLKLVVVDNTINLGYSSYGQDFFRGIPQAEVVPAYTQQTIDDFFAGIDVLLFPTQWKESFGLTVREATARNVWVIATDAGGVTEDIRPGENGLVIPFNDQGQALQEAVLATVEYFNGIAVGDEIRFNSGPITFFADQATELGRIYHEVLAARGAVTAGSAAKDRRQ
ncbi:MAG: glycosyltransferase [Desulfobulbaceae bacterium]|nr:glycosyltransferase [Desulfobulbaceae bacterium]